MYRQHGILNTCKTTPPDPPQTKTIITARPPNSFLSPQVIHSCHATASSEDIDIAIAANAIKYKPRPKTTKTLRFEKPKHALKPKTKKRTAKQLRAKRKRQCWRRFHVLAVLNGPFMFWCKLALCLIKNLATVFAQFFACMDEPMPLQTPQVSLVSPILSFSKTDTGSMESDR